MVSNTAGVDLDPKSGSGSRWLPAGVDRIGSRGVLVVFQHMKGGPLGAGSSEKESQLPLRISAVPWSEASERTGLRRRTMPVAFNGSDRYQVIEIAGLDAAEGDLSMADAVVASIAVRSSSGAD